MRPVVLLAFLILPSCGLLRGDRAVNVDHPEQTTPSGVTFRDLLQGLGPSARVGDEVTIDYEATLEDETPIDSTYDRGQTVSFRLGEAPLAGWDEGLEGMRAGGERRLVIPPWLAYGDEGVPGLVPPAATLVFHVDMVEVQSGQ